MPSGAARGAANSRSSGPHETAPGHPPCADMPSQFVRSERRRSSAPRRFAAAKARVSWEAIEVAEYQPLTDRRPRMRSTGLTSIGPVTPSTINVLLVARPSGTRFIASALVTVARMTLARPACTGLGPDLPPHCRYSDDPKLPASGSLSAPRTIATVLNPSFAANWTPRWPSAAVTQRVPEQAARGSRSRCSWLRGFGVQPRGPAREDELLRRAAEEMIARPALGQ
jgi:hypothetical protein